MGNAHKVVPINEENYYYYYIHDNLLRRHRVCWALNAKWYPSWRITEENPSFTWTWEQVKWRSRSKQNMRCTSTSCWHCNAYMIFCWKGIAFTLALHSKVVLISMISEDQRRKSKLNTTCMITCWKMYSFCWALHAKWYPSVRIDEENPKLNTTSGAGFIEVKVKTK